MSKTILSWTRDERGKVTNRHPSDICNALTAKTGGTTTHYVMEIYIYEIPKEDSSTVRQAREDTQPSDRQHLHSPVCQIRRMGGGLYDNHGQHTMILEVYEAKEDRKIQQLSER